MVSILMQSFGDFTIKKFLGEEKLLTRFYQAVCNHLEQNLTSNISFLIKDILSLSPALPTSTNIFKATVK